MAFVQRSADQQHRHLLSTVQDGSCTRPLQKLSYIPDERFDILEMIKEKDEPLLEVLRGSLVSATTHVQRTLHAFHEFRRWKTTLTY